MVSNTTTILQVMDNMKMSLKLPMITEKSLTPKGDEQKYNPEISVIKLIF
jgi:hypothetical protein